MFQNIHFKMFLYLLPVRVKCNHNIFCSKVFYNIILNELQLNLVLHIRTLLKYNTDFSISIRIR